VKVKILVHITSKRNSPLLRFNGCPCQMAMKYGDNFMSKALTIGLVLAGPEVIRGCE
jgi:hypothetical protein